MVCKYETSILKTCCENEKNEGSFGRTTEQNVADQQFVRK